MTYSNNNTTNLKGFDSERKCYSVMVSDRTDKLLNESTLLKYYSKSTLFEYCVLKQLPLILKEKEIKDSKISEYIEIAQNIIERNFILIQRKEAMSRAYFYKRFLMQLRLLIENQITKEDILIILKLYMQESRSYETKKVSMKKITEIIAKYIFYINKNQSLDRIRTLLQMQIKVVDDLYKEQLVKGKPNV